MNTTHTKTRLVYLLDALGTGQEGWCEEARHVLGREGFEVFGPVEKKHNPFALRFCLDDLQVSHCVLANLVGAKEVCWPVQWQLAWAYAYSKPLFLALEERGSPHDHPFLRDVAFVIKPSWQEAVAALCNVYNRGGNVC